MTRAGLIASLSVAVALAGACGRQTPTQRPATPSTTPGVETTVAPGAVTTPADAPTLPPRQVVAYDCNDGSFLVSEVLRDGKDVLVSLPKRSIRLAREESTPGATYSNRGVTFSMQGSEATLWIEGRRVQCNQNPKRTRLEAAKISGAVALASGNEPGWTLEVHAGELVWTSGSRTRRVNLPEGTPRTDAASGATIYRAELDGSPFVATLTDGPCRDTVSGESFPITVVIEHGGKTLRGCGTRLR